MGDWDVQHSKTSMHSLQTDSLRLSSEQDSCDDGPQLDRTSTALDGISVATCQEAAAKVIGHGQQDAAGVPDVAVFAVQMQDDGLGETYTPQQGGWLGMEVQETTASSCAGLHVSAGALVVSTVRAGGRLARWNAVHTEEAVHEGDLILEVNGQSNPLQIRRQLNLSPVQLRVARHHVQIDVPLQRAADEPLGTLAPRQE